MEKLYLNDTHLYEFTTEIVSISKTGPEFSNRGPYTVVLQQCIFHPQGGGQPSDTGMLYLTAEESGEKTPIFKVNFARDEGGVVELYGEPVAETEGAAAGDFEATLPLSTRVHSAIDREKRQLFARLHSAGHVLDIAVEAAGFKPSELIPSKGYHFPEGPSVDYIVPEPFKMGDVISEEKMKQLPSILNKILADILAKSQDTVVQYLPKERAAELCGLDEKAMHNYPEEVRVVTLAGVSGPCGGTHVLNTAEIGRMEVTKLKKKKNTVVISYRVHNA